MELKPVIIIGAKGLGKVALDIFQRNGAEVFCFLEEDKELHGTEIGEVSVMGSPEDDGFLKYIGHKCDAFVAIDDLSYKKSMVDLLKERRKVMPANAIHQDAVISQYASLGHGNLVTAKSVISAGVIIGDHCLIQPNSLIDYDSTIHNFVQIGAGSVINSNVIIEENAFIGSGATIVSGIKIGKNARVGAGSLVIQDVNEGETVFGNPAQAVKG